MRRRAASDNLNALAIASFNYTGTYGGFLQSTSLVDPTSAVLAIDQNVFRRFSGILFSPTATFDAINFAVTVNASASDPASSFSLDVPSAAVFNGALRGGPGNVVYRGTISLFGGADLAEWDKAALIDSELLFRPVRGRPTRATLLTLRPFAPAPDVPDIWGDWSGEAESEKRDGLVWTVLSEGPITQDLPPGTGFVGRLSFLAEGFIAIDGLEVRGSVDDDGRVILIGQGDGVRLFIGGAVTGATRGSTTFEGTYRLSFGDVLDCGSITVDTSRFVVD